MCTFVPASASVFVLVYQLLRQYLYFCTSIDIEYLETDRSYCLVPFPHRLHPRANTHLHTSAYVSIRQHTSAYVSIRMLQLLSDREQLRQYLYFCTSKASKLSTSRFSFAIRVLSSLRPKHKNRILHPAASVIVLLYQQST
jgi:hypothetical protein